MSVRTHSQIPLEGVSGRGVGCVLGIEPRALSGQAAVLPLHCILIFLGFEVPGRGLYFSINILSKGRVILDQCLTESVAFCGELSDLLITLAFTCMPSEGTSPCACLKDSGPADSHSKRRLRTVPQIPFCCLSATRSNLVSRKRVYHVSVL